MACHVKALPTDSQYGGQEFSFLTTQCPLTHPPFWPYSYFPVESLLITISILKSYIMFLFLFLYIFLFCFVCPQKSFWDSGILHCIVFFVSISFKFFILVLVFHARGFPQISVSFRLSVHICKWHQKWNGVFSVSLYTIQVGEGLPTSGTIEFPTVFTGAHWLSVWFDLPSSWPYSPERYLPISCMGSISLDTERGSECSTLRWLDSCNATVYRPSLLLWQTDCNSLVQLLLS